MSASVWSSPLDELQSAAADPQPVPAGVALSCVTAALALSLLVKVLRITGQREELVEPALRLVEDLRAAADADMAAVRHSIRTRDGRAMRDVPQRAGRAVAEGLALCSDASASIGGLIAADVAAATALMQGAATAIDACVTANR